MGAKPEDLKALFVFYNDTVKPLYNTVQLTNALPQEVLFELNAALDHISRIWTDREAEADAIAKAYSHLKRSCLDIFKLAVKRAIDQFNELRTIDTSIIDNGEFDRSLIELVAAIRDGATRARQAEGNTRDDQAASHAFVLWEPVFADCVTLENDFYRHPKLNWARKKQNANKWTERFWGFLAGVIGSLVAAYIYTYFTTKPTLPPVHEISPPSGQLPRPTGTD